MASREVRSLLFKVRLPLWGDYLQHGYLPGQGDGIPSGNKPGSRLPAPVWFFDIARAFAALNPATVGLADDDNLAWLLHAPFNDEQRAVWLYYVEGLGLELPVSLARAEKQQWAHERDRELGKAVKQRDWRGDELVAERLHCTARTAQRYRVGAVWAIAAFVQWHRPDDWLDSGSKVA
jgi:hypothetical protein